MKRIVLTMMLAAACGAGPAFAVENADPDPVVQTESFLAHHPDLKHRTIGMQAYESGEHAEAMTEFRRAARYADKPSQAMIAEMLMKGEGAAADPALAYAWMDLAAERGYVTFATMRERIWARLSEADRERAIAEGQSIYAEYGDDVAKPRLERMLKQGLRNVTGSRLGFVGALSIQVPGPGGWTRIDGSAYYADKYWKPKDYFEWQDRVWSAPPTGTVDVGPLTASAAEPPSEDENGRK